MGFGPQTETVSREPQDITNLRTGSLSPFLQGIIQNPMGRASNPFSRFLAQSPEQQVLEQTQPALMDLIGGGGMGAGQQVIEAAQPVFQQNLQEAGSQFLAQTPSTFNTAAGAGLGGLQQQALQDFNLFQQQALQQGQQTALRAGQLLGQLGQGAGQAQTQRFVNPTLQLLLGASRLAQPIPPEVVASPGIGSQLLSAAATVGGGLAGSGAFSGGGQGASGGK